MDPAADVFAKGKRDFFVMVCVISLISLKYYKPGIFADKIILYY